MKTEGIARTTTGETVILPNQMSKVLKAISGTKIRTYAQVQKATKLDLASIYTCAHRLERAGLIWRDTTYKGGACSTTLKLLPGVAMLDKIRRL